MGWRTGVYKPGFVPQFPPWDGSRQWRHNYLQGEKDVDRSSISNGKNLAQETERERGGLNVVKATEKRTYKVETDVVRMKS